MLPVVALILGALWGGYSANKKGGDRMDMAQYAAVYGLIFGLAAMVFSVVVGRTFGF